MWREKIGVPEASPPCCLLALLHSNSGAPGKTKLASIALALSSGAPAADLAPAASQHRAGRTQSQKWLPWCRTPLLLLALLQLPDLPEEMVKCVCLAWHTVDQQWAGWSLSPVSIQIVLSSESLPVANSSRTR